MKKISFYFLLVFFLLINLIAYSQQVPNKFVNKRFVYQDSTKEHFEWKKFQSFKKNLDTNLYNQQNYLTQIRTYSKDSLKILTVKLLGIKELYTQKLLIKDISLNKNYYTSILSELKNSNINPKEYVFLENILTISLKEEIAKKYALSKWLNIFLICVILSLLLFIFSKKESKKKLKNAKLSKQELNIQNLILEGKTNKEIAEELFISLSTVKTHITNLYHKLNVSNRSELALKTQK